MKTTCISHPTNERLVVIRKWQVEFCDGNQCAAALLSNFEYWHNWKTNTDSYNKKQNDVAEQHGDERQNSEDVYQYHTLHELSDSILNLFGRNAIIDALKLLESKGIITVHSNPNPRYRFDRTKYYKFYPLVCNAWLTNYCPDKTNAAKFKNKPRSSEIKPSPFEIESSASEKGQTITEINNKEKNQSINARDDLFENNNLESNSNDLGQSDVESVIAALTAKGMPTERFKYPDALRQIRELFQQGASVEIFEESYELAEKTTGAKGFGVRYLAKVVERNMKINKSKSNRSGSIEHKNIKIKNTIYVNDLTKGMSWLSDIATDK